MPSEDTKILVFNQCLKYDKTPSITYPEFQSLIKKVDGCKNNSEKIIHNRSWQTYSLWVFNVYNMDI